MTGLQSEQMIQCRDRKRKHLPKVEVTGFYDRIFKMLYYDVTCLVLSCIRQLDRKITGNLWDCDRQPIWLNGACSGDPVENSTRDGKVSHIPIIL